MIISAQGFGHFTGGINNQDFAIETNRMLLLLDGCSGGKYSEVGTRLFAQLFSRKEECDSVEKFEDNVKNVFNYLIKMMKTSYPVQSDLEREFIMENLLFTIIACFDTETEFIVKAFGDGYIITKNKFGVISYIKLSYGKCPPYFAYKYCNSQETAIYKNYQFKTFKFDKKIFKSVGIGSDGIMPIAKGEILGIDNNIINSNENLINASIINQRQSFYDDVTICLFNNMEVKK